MRYEIEVSVKSETLLAAIGPLENAGFVVTRVRALEAPLPGVLQVEEREPQGGPQDESLVEPGAETGEPGDDELEWAALVQRAKDLGIRKRAPKAGTLTLEQLRQEVALKEAEDASSDEGDLEDSGDAEGADSFFGEDDEGDMFDDSTPARLPIPQDNAVAQGFAKETREGIRDGSTKLKHALSAIKLYALLTDNATAKKTLFPAEVRVPSEIREEHVEGILQKAAALVDLEGE